MTWSKAKERPKRYLLSVGRDKLRERVMEDLWKIVDSEGSSMADEVWDALFMHVERHRDIELEPSVDMSIPDDEFNDVVANEAYEAQEKVVEEILDEESRVSRRVESSNIFGNRRDI
jgi:hypothetical protein